MFSPLDWLVIVLYFLAMAWIGWHFSRGNRDLKDFMFGGGSMPWLAVGISLIATSISASTFLGNPSYAYTHDMRLLMLGFGSLSAIFVIGWVFIPRFKAAGIASAYELLEHRFSRPVRLMAAGLYSCHLMMRVGMLMYVPSLVIKEMIGQPIVVSIVLMAVGSIVYTYFGGIRAIAWTDVMQFVIFMGSGVLVILFCAHAVGGVGETFRLASAAGKTRWFDGTWDPASATNIWSAGLVYIVFEVAIRGCDQQFVQRYLACRSAAEANKSSITSVLLGVCVGLVFYSVGAALFVYFKVKAVVPLPEGLTGNEVFPYFIMNILPTGLKGLLGAAILGEAMSSLNSTYSALSNTTVVDFLGRKDSVEGGEAPGSLKSAKLWVVIWGALGTGMAFICALGSQTILNKALFFTSLFTGPLLGLFLLAFFRPSLHPKAVLAGAVLGMLALLPFLQIPVLPEGMWKPLYTFAWPWNPVISLTATVMFANALGLVWKTSPPVAHPIHQGLHQAE
ncbi:MAG TPA: sodium/solute symporter [Fibrobacteria bacterium]|nr:sodium/solute symporter [Fibrobacteria bacterium]